MMHEYHRSATKQQAARENFIMTTIKLEKKEMHALLQDNCVYVAMRPSVNQS